MDASERGRLLYRLADLLERDKNYLAVSGAVCHVGILWTALVLLLLLLPLLLLKLPQQ